MKDATPPTGSKSRYTEARDSPKVEASFATQDRLSVLFEYRAAVASVQARHLSTAGFQSCAAAAVEIIYPDANSTA